MSNTLLKFKAAGLTKFNTSEYTNFMHRVEEKIKETGVDVLGLTEEFSTSFSKNLTLLDDIVVQSRTDAETKDLSKLDDQRDSLWVYMYTLVDAATKLEIICPEQEAGIALMEQIKPYKKLQSLPNMQETQQIRSLMTDFQKANNAPHIATLHLSFFVEQLQKLNEDYATLTDSRSANRIDSKVGDSKQVRTETDPQYQYMTDIVFAKNVSAPSEVLAKYINNINQAIEEANTAYNQRMAQTKKKDEESKA